MAALHTFDWYVEKFFPHPDEETQRRLADQRAYILSIRNENERLRYVAGLMEEVRDRHRSSSA